MSYNFNSIPTVPPTGSVAPFTGTTDPSGWVICDGVSRSNASGQYNNLINANLVNITSTTFSINAVSNSSLGSGTWNTISLSSDGTTSLAGNSASVLYISTNSGSTYYSTTSYGNLSGTKNWTGAAVSSNNQIMAACANGDYVYLSSNSGRTWSNQASNNAYTMPSSSTVGQSWTAVQPTTYTGIGQNWTLLTNSTGLVTNASFYTTSMSSTGQFMLAGIYGGVTYLSTNYGGNWKATPTGLSASANYTGSSISYNGQYMMVSTSAGTNYFSNTYGASFSTTSATGATGCAMSADGKYLLSANWISSNYGSSWAAIASGTGITTTNVNFWQPAISATGQYMLLTSKQSLAGSPVNISTSYGSFWTQNAISGLSTSAAATGCSVSASGQFMVVLVFGGSVYLSSTYGANWAQTPGSGLAASANYYSATMSSSGQYILIGGNAGTSNSAALSYFSSNYGANWLSAIGTPTQSYGISMAMSSTGQYMLNAGYGNAGVYMSTASLKITITTGYGQNFTPLSVTGAVSNEYWIWTSISQTGQYILVCSYFNLSVGGRVYLSTNFGSSFVHTPGSGLATGGQRWLSTAMNYTGQYMLAGINETTSSNTYLSTNYGVNWAALNQTGRIQCISISSTGQYILLSFNQSYIYLSSTYGAGFYVPNGIVLTNRGGCSMSPDGKYMSAIADNAFSMSTNYGVSWITTPGTGLSSSDSYQSTAMTSNGYFVTMTIGVTSVSSGNIYVSSNYGVNWRFSTGGMGIKSYFGSICISQFGQYIIMSTTNNGGVVLSTDYGNSWTNPITSGDFWGCTMTPDAKYMLTCSTSGTLYRSSAITSTTTTTTQLSPTVTTTTPLTSVAPNYWYRFETADVNGTNLLNYASGLYDATLVNGATITTTSGQYKVGSGALSLTTGSSQYVSVNTLPTFSASGFSISFWAHLISIPGGGASRIWDLANILNTDSGTRYTFLCMINGTNLQFEFPGGVSFSTPAPQSIWKHYVCTYSSSGAAKFYIDGVLTNSTTGNTYPGSIPMSYFYFGKSTYVTDPYITCYIDDFQFYNGYILTQNEVTNIYNYKGGALTTSITSSAFPYPYWYSVTTEQTGQYVVVGSIMNQGIWYSTDFATTWQNSNQILGTVQQLANSGTYMLAAINNISGVWYSSNYGAWWQSAASSTSNNFASVAMSSSSTYSIAGSFDGGVTYSSTYGQTWKTSNLTTNTYLEVAMSSTGQYALASNNTTIYYSTNFGQTFIASSLTSINTQSLGISASGQFAVAGTTAGIYYSMNFGQSWTQALGQASTGTWYGINMISSGQYVVAGNAGQGLWYSLTGGQTWTQSTTNKTDTWYQISATPSGSYLYAVSQSDTIYQETNVTSSMSISNGLPNSTSSWQTLSMNNTGQYQIAGVNPGYLFYTNNYGNAWSTLSGPSLITGVNNTNGLPTSTSVWNTSAMNSTGQYALAGIGGGALYLTTNMATTWTAISGVTGATTYGMTTNALTWQTTSMNSTGQYMMAGILYDFLLYLSTNYGSYWTAIVGGGASSLITPNVSGLLSNVTPAPSSSNPWTINGVTWTSSASSFYDINYSSLKAFDNTPNNHWNTDAASQYNNTSGVYTGTAFGTNVSAPISSTIYGEWVQIQSSVPFIIQNYKLSSGDATGRGPKIFYIVGSNNGTTWYPIQYVNIAGNPYSATRTEVSNSISAQTAVSGVTFGTSTITTTVYTTSGGTYTYFRMIVTSTVGNYDNTLSLGEWAINFSSINKQCSSAISSTGQRMAIGLTNNAFYFSQNYGKNWTAYSNSPLSTSVNWQTMSISSNGLAIVASVNTSNVYNINAVAPTATYVPPQINGTTSTDGTTVNYIIKI